MSWQVDGSRLVFLPLECSPVYQVTKIGIGIVSLSQHSQGLKFAPIVLLNHHAERSFQWQILDEFQIGKQLRIVAARSVQLVGGRRSGID